MVTYDYTDLDSGEPTDPDEGAYSVMELNREHLVRYVLQTSKGAVVLRHLPLRMARVIESVRRTVYPSAVALEEEYEAMRKAPPEQMTEEQVADFLRLDRELAMTDMTALGVIVEPRLAGMDDYEALYEALDDGDRLRLTTAVRVLASVRDPRTVDPTAEAVARSAGIRLVTDDMLELMTVSQAAYHIGRISKEAKAIDRAAGRVRVR